jgi:amino acid permease
MTIVLNIKSLGSIKIKNMYNHRMTKQQRRKRPSMIFLILGMAFLAIGIGTDQTTFTWIAIVFILISLVAGGRWLRPKK